MSETQLLAVARAVIRHHDRHRLDVHVAEVPASRRLLELLAVAAAVEVAAAQDVEAARHRLLRAHRHRRAHRRGRLPVVAARHRTVQSVARLQLRL